MGAARHRPGQSLPRSRRRRQLSGASLAGGLRQRRVVGQGTGRGHGQGCAARRACRFRLRGRRRGTRPHRLRADYRPVRVCRAARFFAAAAGAEPVRAARRDRPPDPVWAAGGDQHGLGAAADPDQGDDPAVPQLRRLVDAGAGAGHGDAARADPAAIGRGRAMSPVYVLAAGGTGGHLFPAEAVARLLVEHGGAVHLLTDRRADAFAAAVPGVTIDRVRAGRLGGGPLHAAYGLAELAVGIVQARRLLRRLAPAAVAGFGGYPSVPTMLAAARLDLPTLIHEQNVVLGRANRLLAPRARRIATGFAATQGLRDDDRVRAVHTGFPVC